MSDGEMERLRQMLDEIVESCKNEKYLFAICQCSGLVMWIAAKHRRYME